MSLGSYRPVEKVQPGWLISACPPGAIYDESKEEWVEVRAIFEFRSGKREIHYMDGSKTYGWVGDEVRCITLAEKRQRRLALGEEKASA